MHAMPFGAELRGEATRFRIWAPACASVRLQLGSGAPRELPMEPCAGGWHALTVAGALAGERYAFRVDDGPAVPDPASRANPDDVAGASAIVDPGAFDWDDDAWRGRPWHEAVVYELHVGTFTPEGTYAAAAGKLDHLAALGVTAIELMPLAEFPGRRSWGYDGVLPFAPDAAYGTPADLKRLVQAAHARGLMVLLDVVYNHFGPEGNHLMRYAPQFFNPAHRTPWGAAINFDGEHARVVRDFFVHNALYWIEEYGFDGLRMDAVHAIADDSPVHIVSEIAQAIAAGPGRERHVHLVLENEHNESRFLERSGGAHATAQWNDAAHHAFHVLLTGETDGYYRAFAAHPARRLAHLLAEGFDPQLPLAAYVPFLQNHDQVGNRAFGERLARLAGPEALRLAAATLLLAPSPPLIFMGEEWGARTPFLYFCDFHGELARAVRDGRRREFAAFARFADPAVRESIPDPNAEETFHAAKLDWGEPARAEHAACLGHTRALLRMRAAEIVPRLASGVPAAAFDSAGATATQVDWTFGDGSRLHLRANFGSQPVAMARAPGEALHREGDPPDGGMFAPWSGAWTLERA